ncbi:hypothetical protein JMA_39710 (plasmid) [Jeotgalibacillus malaysiensis]|uniref:Uncharacterized protein n=1 Tax=Jeotgalibacillus malaysiensis TaxID=1508404 RepID=A0A0B5AZC2_9BACL|nr:hypothetical protein [Jeotgalibacillus malaysiensis]AJD93289.1 hypothetical protein JMA_39710 [Jeotgalibacillus malaysiensis]
MNPIKFDNVLKRLKKNAEETIAFHQEHADNLSYIELYFERVWKHQGFLQKRHWLSNLRNKTDWNQYFDKENNVYSELFTATFRKQYAEFNFNHYGYEKHVGKFFDDMSEYEDLVYFYMLHLSRYAMAQGFPRIRFVCESTIAERFVNDGDFKHYTISERLKKPASEVTVTFELSDGTNIESLTAEQLSTTANAFFKDEYEFKVRENWNSVKTASSELSIRVTDVHALEIEMARESEVVQRYTKNRDFSNDHIGFPKVYLSHDKELMKEELDVIIWMSFYELYESKENIHNLSLETTEILRKWLWSKGRLSFNNGLKDDLREFLLSGEWTEEDNYRNKLIRFLQSLKAVDGSMMLTLFYYDGSVEGLPSKAYIAIEHDNMNYLLRDFKTVFFTKDEADTELKRVNQLVIEQINKKAT